MTDGATVDYDPDARRDTPLARLLREQIRRDGPLPLSLYMQTCLTHPTLGYYGTRPAIGRDGDFITAPEISQTFGELIGLWCAVVWQQMGSPAAVALLELGPGRGTLMQDVLRATARVPGFHAALQVTLIDVSPALIAQQRHLLSDAPVPVRWLPSLAAVAAADGIKPTIVIANEFLDTRAPDFLIWQSGRLRRHCVGLDQQDRLVYTAADDAVPRAPALTAHPLPDGTCVEHWAPLSPLLGLTGQPLAALFVDYGHRETAAGASLQAVRQHRFEHPLTAPGEADLSVQVDFSAVARGAVSAGLAVDGPVVQAEFLGALGILERASRLMAANPKQANAIEISVARLMAATGMGTRFKALGLRSPGLPALPGF